MSVAKFIQNCIPLLVIHRNQDYDILSEEKINELFKKSDKLFKKTKELSKRNRQITRTYKYITHELLFKCKYKEQWFHVIQILKKIQKQIIPKFQKQLMGE